MTGHIIDGYIKQQFVGHQFNWVFDHINKFGHSSIKPIRRPGANVIKLFATVSYNFS